MGPGASEVSVLRWDIGVTDRRLECLSYLLLLPLLALAVSGNPWGLVGVGVWFLAYGVRRER